MSIWSIRALPQTGHRVWGGISSSPLTGFSHGAAGGAYALLRLARMSGRAAFRAAAEEALEYENVLFDAFAR